MTRLFAVATLALLAVPAAFAAPPATHGQAGGTTPNPSQLCTQQLHTMGLTNFRSTYAPNGHGKNAFGKCVSRQAQVVEGEAKNAAKECKAERGTTPETIAAFELKYGTNKNKKNAFGKCVSGKTTETVEEQQQATLNAAKKCKAERGTTEASRAAFAEEHGTNKNGKNAFGKCVSKNTKPASTP